MPQFDPATGQLIPESTPTQTPTQLPPAQQPLVIQMPAPPPATVPSGGLQITPELQAYIDAERERVRTEEKNKLYPQIDELKGRVTVLTTEYEERKAAEEQAQQATAEAERKRLEEEASSKDLFLQYQSESERRFAQIEEDRARERALWQKEADFRSLEDYKARRKAEEADNIIPQFMDRIGGSTQEAVEQSIVDMKARSASLVADIQGSQPPPPARPGIPVTGSPAVDMTRLGENETKTYTPAELQAMSLDEYAAVRSQLLQAGSNQIRERGLYG